MSSLCWPSLGLGAVATFVSAVKTQWRRWDDYMADLVVVDPFEHAALVHVRIVHDLGHIAHRGAGDAVLQACQARAAEQSRFPARRLARRL